MTLTRRHAARRFSAVLVAFTLVAVTAITVGANPVLAVSRNEILTSVTFDGTAPFAADPVDDINQYPSPHTPGLDERGDNGVVRSFDTFGIRIDWNINEDAATNVVLTTTLPDGYTWAPQPAPNPPDPDIFAGCLTATHGVTPPSSISADQRTLVCNVGDQTEGSNGTIFPTVLVNGILDGEEISVSATLTTDDDAAGVSDEIDDPLIISARPFGDWVKTTPEVVANVDNGGVDGSLLIFPLTFTWASGQRGSEPLNDAAPIQFFDHPWDLPNSELATAAMMPGGRVPCGQYDGVAPIIVNGAWVCSDIGDQGQGYSTIQLDITGHNTAGLSGSVSLHGQIAFWVPQTDLDARMLLASPENTVYNSITGDPADVITFDKTAENPADDPANDITPISLTGTNIVVGENTTANNSALYSTNPPGTGGGGGSGGNGILVGSVFNTISIEPGKYQQVLYSAIGDATVAVKAPDLRSENVGGLFNRATGSAANRSAAGIAAPPISRGEDFFITASVAAQESVNSPNSFDDPFHLCVALDLDNYELVPFVDFTENKIPPLTTGVGVPFITPAISSQVLPPSDGILAHVLTGTNSLGPGTWDNHGATADHTGAVVGDELTYAVEFSTDAAQLGHSVGEDAIDCSDAAGTWQDASAAAAGDFPSITRVRVRMLDRYPWAGDESLPQLGYPVPAFAGPRYFPGPSMTLNLQAKVKDDIAIQVDGEELFVYSSRGMGAWDDAAGRPEGVYTDWMDLPDGDEPSYESSCRILLINPFEIGLWTDDGNTETTLTGWCNEPYIDAGVPSDFAYSSSGQRTARIYEHHADKRFIQSVKPVLSKTNVDGVNDVADNGDLVRFSLKPSTVGATGEALANVFLIDNLNTTKYTFVQFIQQPATAPPCTEAGDVITCQFSEPDPAVDTSPLLPPGIPGGWSDEVIIEVMAEGGIAGIPPTFNTNAATLISGLIGPWDGSDFSNPPVALAQDSTGYAGSYMPPPAHQSLILKAVDALEGPCVAHPDQDPAPIGWGDRCSQIDYNGNVSFTLSIENDGNTPLDGIRMVDVFPHLADEVEAISNTVVDGVNVPTIGDGRSPESDFDGTVAFVSLTGPNTTTAWVTGDDPATVSRDPDRAISDTVWCDAAGGTVQNGVAGSCPATDADVTATYASWSGTLNPGDTYTQTLTLDSQDVQCDNIWTNSFGSRSDQIFLPIRSNDVSVMVNCEYDIALKKVIDPGWTPGADWLTPGSSTVDFLLEIENQGDPIEDFDVTDYLDSIWTIVAADNPGGNTGGDQALPYTWDLTDPDAPVVTVDGALAPTETVTVPISLVIDAAWIGGDLDNFAEISRFDSDGDPSNGDSDPTNPNNPSTGPLIDEDSTPDAINGEEGDNRLEDDVTDENETVGDLSGDGVIDEDDHDIETVPFYDLELIKTVRTPGVVTTTTPYSVVFDLGITNQGPLDVYGVDVTEYGAVGLTYDPAATAALWATESITTVSDASPTFTISGPIAAGVTFTFPVVFQITDLTAAPYTNTAEISAFDNDDDANNTVPAWVVDVDSTPDTTNDDDLIDQTSPNYDPDNDSNLNEPTPGDEDDHDIATVELPFDLALRKRVDPTDPDLLDGISNGDKITFFVEVFNQGRDVEDFDVTDYVSDSWLFDPADNPAGTTTAGSLGGPALPFTWDTTDLTAPVAEIVGALATLESVFIPVVLTVDIGTSTDTGDGLVNHAEISRFDSDGDPSNGDSDPANPDNPQTGELVDLDSTPDAINSDTLVDDVIDNTGGDEDDHDIASTLWFDLALIKRSADVIVDPRVPTPTVSYEIVVKNQAPNAVVNVVVVDTPPLGFTYSALVSPPAGVTLISAADGTFGIAGLAAGEEVMFTVEYIVDIDLVAAPSVNTAEIASMQANYDPDGPAGPLVLGIHDAADIDSTPDSDPSNDAITDGDPANMANGTLIDFVEDSHNDVDFDADGDGNINLADGLDEDDHDTEAVQVAYDLALIKQFVSMDTPLVSDGTVTMSITITNQGPAVELIEVADYLSGGQWAGFEAALNPAGTATGSAAASFTYSWDGADPLKPIATLVPTQAGDKLARGETSVIPIVVRISPTFDSSAPFVNIAEISRFDSDQDPTNGDSADNDGDPSNGLTPALIDIDSTPDATDVSNPGEDMAGALIDNVIDGDGKNGGDEDDHDPVIIPIMDLALRKTLDVTKSDLPAAIGAKITFNIEIINQGNVDVTDPTVIDYVDQTMWLPFAVADNPAGTTTGDTGLAYTWAASATDGAVSLVGTLKPGETAIVPVTLEIVSTADLSNLLNTAEITGGVATVDNDDDPTTPPVPITTPDTDEPLVDIDSTPDTTNDDPLVDDVIDNSGGDEDDHDVAMVTPPTYSLGNQVWFDVDNDGKLEDGEAVIEGVVVDLFVDADGDGMPDDTNGDGVIDSSDAVASTTTDADGAYLFTELEANTYVVGIAPSNWDVGGPLYAMLPSDPVETDPDTDIDDDNNGFAGKDGYVLSGPVTINAGEPTNESGFTNDPNTPDSNSNLTVDFGFWAPQFDLALRKTVVNKAAVYKIGDVVTFNIEVFNQGNTDATDIVVVDYLPEGTELADSTWTQGAAGEVTKAVDGTLSPGDSVSVTIALRLLSAGSGTVENFAEIIEATPTREDGKALVLPSGLPVPDVDSVADAINDDRLVNDVIDNSGDDEDDHDLAVITVASALAKTGSSVLRPVLVAGLLLLIGLGLVMLGRHRRKLWTFSLLRR